MAWLKANWARDVKKESTAQNDDHLTITSMCEAFEPLHMNSALSDADDIDTIVESRTREMHQAHVETMEAKGYL